MSYKYNTSIKNYFNNIKNHVSLTVLILSFSGSLIAQDYIMLPPNGIGGTNSAQNFVPSPYYSDQNVTRFQCTYNRNELLAGGAPEEGCQINSIGFNIEQVISANFYNNGSGLKGYTIKMRNIGVDTIAIGNYFRPIDDSHIVKFPFNVNNSVISTTGFTDFVFDTPFFWNGEGNILLDICYGINDGTASTNISRGIVRMHGFNVFAANPSVRKFNFASEAMCGMEDTEMQGNSLKPVARLNFGPTQIPECNISVSPAFVTICQGDSVDLTVSGANTYQWNNPNSLSCTDCSNPIASPTSNTIIQVIGFDGLCSDTAFVNINVAEKPNVTITPSEDLYLCSGSVQLNASSGLSNYNWSHGETGTSVSITEQGEYFVTAQNSEGCTGQSENVNVNAAYNVDVTISASSTAICEGESVTLSTNQNFTSYSWTSGQNTNAISISQAGTYSLNVTDVRGCSGVSNSINIEVMDSPLAGYEYTQTTGYTIVFNNTSIHGNTYLWIFHNNTTSTEENPSFTYPFDAVYPVTLIAFNDCGSDTIFENVIVDKISSVNDLNSISNLNIFPNPSHGIFTIEGQSNGAQQYKFRVLNMLGQEIHSSNISVHGQWNKTLDLKLYSKGVYWIIIEDNKTKVSRKLVLM
jgi:hypothetical protein